MEQSLQQLIQSGNQVVCVQGLGFVGAAMMAALASATGADGKSALSVIGVDLDTPRGNDAIAAVNAGRFPYATVDRKLEQAMANAGHASNMAATTDAEVYRHADVVCVDVHLDVNFSQSPPTADFDVLRKAIRTLADRIPETCLVLVETTVPPGTCEKVVLPVLRAGFEERGLDPDKVLLAHSYERVMPGENYLDSIINYWRVFSGSSEEARRRCRAFLSTFINTDAYPLTELSSMTASETAKILENSYRATTIAFMEEWGRFAESVDIDMFEIVDAIRMRPTHSNMRTPGFGVGGYCLTKDPFLAKIASRDLFGLDLDFPFSSLAVETNQGMPFATIDLVRKSIGDLRGKKILLCGVSYRPGVADTRYAPAEQFVKEMRRQGAELTLNDPLVGHWMELDIDVPRHVPEATGFDAVVFAVSHDGYRDIDMKVWLKPDNPVVIDAQSVLSAAQKADIIWAGSRLISIGRGEEK